MSDDISEAGRLFLITLRIAELGEVVVMAAVSYVFLKEANENSHQCRRGFSVSTLTRRTVLIENVSGINCRQVHTADDEALGQGARVNHSVRWAIGHLLVAPRIHRDDALEMSFQPTVFRKHQIFCQFEGCLCRRCHVAALRHLGHCGGLLNNARTKIPKFEVPC